MKRTALIDAPAREDTAGSPQCPTCDTAAAMVPLGTRVDHPRRWLRWARTVTHIYICTRCCAVAEMTEVTGRVAAL